MKLVSYQIKNGTVQTGVLLEKGILNITDWLKQLAISQESNLRNAHAGLDAPEGGMMRFLQAGEVAIQMLREHVGRVSALPNALYDALEDVRLYAPVPRPGKIIGVGRNYADHAKETGVQPFENPRIIFKASSSIAAPGQAIKRPTQVKKLDFEVELAVVIGGYGKDLSDSEALSIVGGYTVLNDLSAREFQFDIPLAQTTFAKSMDGFAPLGPWLVTSDEIPDPQNLEVFCWVNGKQMQHGRTCDMLFPVARIISYLSSYMTLEPGDVIGTGTPAGIGAFRDPPIYLQPGDELRLEVTQVGALSHKII
jgi:2-keto-4-pentenoate hydratase/2-oxohepta-3-ene-1,7-dioic acid hydratase in catechol pathway